MIISSASCFVDVLCEKFLNFCSCDAVNHESLNRQQKIPQSSRSRQITVIFGLTFLGLFRQDRILFWVCRLLRSTCVRSFCSQQPAYVHACRSIHTWNSTKAVYFNGESMWQKTRGWLLLIRCSRRAANATRMHARSLWIVSADRIPTIYSKVFVRFVPST